MFKNIVEVICNTCKTTFKAEGENMTRGEAMKLASAKGWKHIDAKTHACPKHAAKVEPKAAKKVAAKPAKKADGKKIARPVPAVSTKTPPF